MVEQISAEQATNKVGVDRHNKVHLGRASSADQKVYILHSGECLIETGGNLLSCEYSQALEWGIDSSKWEEDIPTVLGIFNGRLYQREKVCQGCNIVLFKADNDECIICGRGVYDA